MHMPRSIPAAFAVVVLAASAASAQQNVPPLYDGSNTTFTITPGSNLRTADSLTSRITHTLWQGAQVKGAGTCSQNSCPVIYEGQNLFARRTRLRMPGLPGTGGTIGSTIFGGGQTAIKINRTLRRGDDGDDVMRLQEALNRSGASVTVDRKYGRGTRSAVESFQRARGLKVDGVAGPATLQALGV